MIKSFFLVISFFLSTTALAQVTLGCSGKPYNGEYRCEWGNGNISEEGTMRNGEQHGEKKSYWHDGSLHYIWNYNMGEAHGSWKTYSIDGVIEEEQIWENGEKISDKQYDENGRLESWEKWDSQGRQQGDQYYYNADGSYIMRSYRSDEILLSKYYRNDGSLSTEERSLPDYKFWVQNFDENGT
jgi:antitoxin component YwqK of YwqJK toxin-antitoxin module